MIKKINPSNPYIYQVVPVSPSKTRIISTKSQYIKSSLTIRAMNQSPGQKSRKYASKMESSIRENGRAMCDMDMGFSYGQMEPDTRGTGKTEKHQVEENLLMSMEISMTASGEMIKLVVAECIFITMVLAIKENGSMITSMALGFRNGSMEAVMKVCIRKEKNMGKESISGEMAVIITATGSRIKLQDLESMFGLMDEDISGIGSIIRCMEMASTAGETVVAMKETISLIKSTALGPILGPTVVNT